MKITPTTLTITQLLGSANEQYVAAAVNVQVQVVCRCHFSPFKFSQPLRFAQA
jgi:hypothetical protein